MADGVFREGLPGCADYACALFQAAARKGNVGCDHDVVRLHMFHNPIIGCVETVLYNFEGNSWFIRDSHPGVGHQSDIKATSACDAVHLLFDRVQYKKVINKIVKSIF